MKTFHIELSKCILDSSIYRMGKEVCTLLQKNAFQAYIVGGSVRDILMSPEQVPTDLDLCTDALPDDLFRLFPGTRFVGKSFGVCRVPMEDSWFEVATFRKEGTYSDRRHPDFVEPGTLEEDSRRRDFTVNALYLDPVKAVVTDFWEGMQDLSQSTLKCVGNPRDRLFEDPLRILRMFRFATKLGFKIDPLTLTTAKNVQEGVGLLSRDRVLMEVSKVPHLGITGFFKSLLDCVSLSFLIPGTTHPATTVAQQDDKPIEQTQELFNAFPEFSIRFPFLTVLFNCWIISDSHFEDFLSDTLKAGFNLTSPEKRVVATFQRNTEIDEPALQMIWAELKKKFPKAEASLSEKELGSFLRLEKAYDTFVALEALELQVDSTSQVSTEFKAKALPPFLSAAVPEAKIFRSQEWKSLCRIASQSNLSISKELSRQFPEHPAKEFLTDFAQKNLMNDKMIGKLHKVLTLAALISNCNNLLQSPLFHSQCFQGLTLASQNCLENYLLLATAIGLEGDIK